MSEPKDSATENHPPEHDDNFLHVVIYAGIFLVIGLIAAFVLIKGVGKHIVPGRHNPHPTSQLILPAANSSYIATAKVNESSFIFSRQNPQTCV